MELWTPEHLQTLPITLVIMLVVAVILRKTIGQKSMKVRMIPFQIFAVILFVLEIGKQALSLSRGYDLYHLPFHFCSLFIFVLPLMSFYRGKYEHTVRCATTAFCAGVFLLMLIYPNLIYSGDSIKSLSQEYLSFHTVVFHNIVMMELILIIALDLNTPQKGDWKKIVFTTLAFCAVAATMAQLLQTNFANFYVCNIAPIAAVVDSIRPVLGEVLTQAIYIVAIACVHVLFVLLANGLSLLVRKLLIRKTPAAV